MRKFLILAATTLLLVGCSGEPGKSDMEKAVGDIVKGQIEQARNLASMFGGPAAANQVPEFKGFHSFEKIGCKELTDRAGYNCDAKFSVNEKDEPQQLTLRFTKGESGWSAQEAK